MATVSAEIDVQATPAEILDVLADLTTYPQWSAVHRRVSVQTTTRGGRPKRATMSVAAAGLTDEQTIDYRWSDHGVSWSLVKSGQQRRQQGSYSIKRGRHGMSHVHYELTIDPLIPLPGIIVRRVMKKAVAAATDGLKQRVESLPDSDSSRST
jgi:ribosome-associated toxin RatA of RatAB toxin-antitoxin module